MFDDFTNIYQLERLIVILTILRIIIWKSNKLYLHIKIFFIMPSKVCSLNVKGRIFVRIYHYFPYCEKLTKHWFNLKAISPKCINFYCFSRDWDKIVLKGWISLLTKLASHAQKTTVLQQKFEFDCFLQQVFVFI